MEKHPQIYDVRQSLEAGQTLAVADRILISPTPGELARRTQELLRDITLSGSSSSGVCSAVIRLGMNFAGRDSWIVGYGEGETEKAFHQVIQTLGRLFLEQPEVVRECVAGFLSDMKSVNRADSLPGLLAERIEPALEAKDPGGSFLRQLKQEMRSGVYWKMIAGGYAKFGNDYARGLEYLRHYGFCQVSTNPVLAAKAFDEDERLTGELKTEILRHSDWIRDPSTHADAIVMAATLIALWPNLAVFRPLALHRQLKDYMVSFQLNPNIADDTELSLADARRAYQLATDYLERYDRFLGLGPMAGAVGPNIVFKIAGSAEAARHITRRLNAEGIGTNNTVVYSVGQEVQLILDAFQGKAEGLRNSRVITRTYETNMGGRFASHLREVVAENLFQAAAERGGEAQVHSLLDALADALKVDGSTLNALEAGSFTNKVRTVCAFRFLKTLNHPVLLTVADQAGRERACLVQMEDDIRKSGTLVARRVYSIFFKPINRVKWQTYLQKTCQLNAIQAREVLESMDVLPASKRIPEDTFHALGETNMCHTEFPNQARAVQLSSEQEGFRLEEFRESVMGHYDPAVVNRLTVLPDFVSGYELNPSLQGLLDAAGVKEAIGWGSSGIEPENWPNFGPVQKTSAEFQAAYKAFASKCVSIAREATDIR